MQVFKTNAAARCAPIQPPVALVYPPARKGFTALRCESLTIRPLQNSGSSTTILIDPRSGKIQRHIDPPTCTPADTFLAWVRPPHTGEALGIGGRVVVCIVGLVPPPLVTTGTLMWLRQRRTRSSASIDAVTNGVKA